MDSITKKCGHCHEIKPITSFGKGKNKDGLCSYCRECKSEEARIYSEKYHERKLESSRKSYQKNKDNHQGYGRDYHKATREKVFELLGHVCARCGFSDKRALQVDHIHGGGSKERKIMTAHTYNMHVLEVGKSDYQILCANCNWIKRHENKEHGGKS